MTTRSQVQFNWGTASEIAAYTGVAREVIVDTTNERLVLMDGTTAGGKPMASESYVQTQVAGASGGAGPASAFVLWGTCT
ncbi:MULTISPECIES: hypothetical protein [unclassified Bradyrhizobium]|uniref:hyaluronate lyase N-terminal domain-containing protein n=1 Tax=unclassified Bradyrhizobium TaxID=2631580 RepID=UPI002915EC06|nr:MULTISPECIES: hypothetical protein [unclassified Bradyrhizobium]